MESNNGPLFHLSWSARPRDQSPLVNSSNMYQRTRRICNKWKNRKLATANRSPNSGLEAKKSTHIAIMREPRALLDVFARAREYIIHIRFWYANSCFIAKYANVDKSANRLYIHLSYVRLMTVDLHACMLISMHVVHSILWLCAVDKHILLKYGREKFKAEEFARMQLPCSEKFFLRKYKTEFHIVNM